VAAIEFFVFRLSSARIVGISLGAVSRQPEESYQGQFVVHWQVTFTILLLGFFITLEVFVKNLVRNSPATQD